VPPPPSRKNAGPEKPTKHDMEAAESDARTEERFSMQKGNIKGFRCKKGILKVFDAKREY
jgi:hypothetical protein